MEAIVIFFLVVEVISLILNGMVFGMLIKQQLHQIDITLALVMVLCDSSVIFYKLFETICYYSGYNLLEDHYFGQIQGVYQVFFLQLSAACVGLLALIRFWVIVLRKPVHKKVWLTGFIVHQGILLAVMIGVAKLGEFQLTVNKRYYYPAFDSKYSLVKVCRYLLAIYFGQNIIAMNLSYPFITRRYLTDLSLINPDQASEPGAIDNSLRKLKINLVFKMVMMIITYDVVMIPYFVYISLQVFFGYLPNASGEFLVGVSLIFLTIVNPVMLLVLHYNTGHLLCDWISSWLNRLSFKTRSLTTAHLKKSNSKTRFAVPSNHSDIALTSRDTLPLPY